MWKLFLVSAAFTAIGQEFDSHAVSETMVPMRDKVQLATDVYRPARAGAAVEGKFPVLVVRTPYNKAGLARSGAWFAQRGYVVVAQDCRGRFRSEGDFYAFLNEGLDGYDTIEWAAAQPWSTGKVGTFGGSYLAWDQHHAAMYRPPHLEAMFAIVGGSNFYQDYAFPGGAPNLGWGSWLLQSARSSPLASKDPATVAPINAVMPAGPMAWLSQHPNKRAGAFELLPAHHRMYADFYGHPEFGDWWKQKGWYTRGHYNEIKDVPTVFLSGWYDYFGEGTLENFAELARRQKTPKKLIMGPWPHGTGRAECGELTSAPPRRSTTSL